MPSRKKFYITTAIAYVNAPPHLGHALEFIQADAIARYKRLMGLDTYFLTGTDEHGVKIVNTAKNKGVEIRALVDKNAEHFKALKGLLELSYDDFIQTTDRERHWPACQKLWKKLVEKDDIYKKEYEGLYCEGCETFMKETELQDGNCPIHKRPPAPLKEENYFFRLSRYSDRIVELIENGTLKLLPENRQTEFLNVAKDGLHDVSFSRPRDVLSWGVDVPDDESQVMYVWCDALTNYISALGYADEGALYKKYWPADVHVIGKDIVRFHAGIWIGMLLSADVPLPKSILIHGFITHNGDKMSKTLGNVVDPVGMAERYGPDALRYYLLREIPTGRDGDFSDQLFVERYNSDLANNLGNLVNRVHTLITRNQINEFAFDRHFELYKKKVDETWKKYVEDMDHFNLHEAIFHIWRLVDFANKMMEEEKPWSLVKSDSEKGRAVLSNLLEVLRHISILISPFIPETSQKIRKQLGLPLAIDREKEDGWGVMTEWKGLGEAEIIFPRIES
ncbi:class I tRNA ligase family protein [Patescibacteria group bacterium]|nr:class I tRNA ligase family protein [Patescibacteria group bacterium]MBU1685292.1 class I tRNA ligase family protein [Patescibacteria group bacterium]MBU1938323.1 class I tRNA ligase family protein [Patescibacteria group bacterium]